MELIETSYKDYAATFETPYHVFNRAAFCELNVHRCRQVKYLVFRDSKVRLGLIGGVRNNMLLSPFSAPFGGFSFLDFAIKISHVEEAVRLLDAFAVENGWSAIRIILPPVFYCQNFISKVMNVLYRSGFTIANLDLDFYFDLENKNDYDDRTWYNARKNLRLGLSSNLATSFCTSQAEKEEAYNVIHANRMARGFPMTMKCAEVMDTANVVNCDFFLCRKDTESIAAAIVYHVTDDIVYVPYWGDKPGFGRLKPMNTMSFHIFEHYKALGKEKVHIGIGTEDSIPNYGLSEFKESIGCSMEPKFTFTKTY